MNTKIINVTENENLIALQQEVIETHNKIIDYSKENAIINKIYKGCIIYISPIYLHPKILFLGINPGSGYYREHNQIIQQFTPLNKPDGGYGLWLQLEKCFNTIGKSKYIESMVKTNICFFATYNQYELNLLYKKLPNEFSTYLKNKQKNWIKTIINEIKPQNILCGGALPLNLIKSLYPNIIITKKGKNVSVCKINDTYIISFKRYKNNIIGKLEFLKALEEYLK